jgi:O-antigen biosynthesis protein
MTQSAEMSTVQISNAAVKAVSNPRVVCISPNHDTALFDLRLKIPLERWAWSYGGSVRFKTLAALEQEDLDWGDVHVIQRYGSEYVEKLVDYLKDNKKSVVFEIDDLLTELPAFLSHHPEADPRNRSYLQNVIRKASAITVTTPRLAAHMREYNSKVYCIPNCSQGINGVYARHTDTDANTLSLIVAASDRVLVTALIPVLRSATNLGKPVRVIAVGPPADILRAGGISVEHHPLMSYESFKRFVATLDNPIGLIPLDDSVFSSCKSPIKFFDYAVAGVPSICSAVPPYSDYVIDGETGFLVGDRTEDWLKVLKDLAGSASLRSRIAGNAASYVSKLYGWNSASEVWGKVIQEVFFLNGGPDRRNLPRPFVPPRSARTVVWLLKKLTTPSAYVKSWALIKKSGWSGLIKHVIRR